MTYIRALENAVRSYHIQNFNNPERCVPEYKQDDPEEWRTANRLWEDWMEGCWVAVVEAYAGIELSESERMAKFGRWEDRHADPGANLLRIINKDRPAIDKWLDRTAIRLGLRV